ncbi:MAG: alpha/beta hydrolase [Rhizobiaceae bacterium]
MIADWDDAYNNGGHIARAETYPPRWAAAAAAFRDEMTKAGRAELDIAYGEGERERFDLYRPDGPSKGLIVFVHGGYWMKFGRDSFSHLARGGVEAGWTAALPSYDLAPAIHISGITRQIGGAIEAAAERVAGPIHIAGHSAGGHLVSRMACIDTPLTPAARDRLQRIVSISGLHDLRPLMKTAMNDTLHLDADEARAESAALNEPLPGKRIVCWVGSLERPEFVRQNDLLANVWTGLGAEISARHDEGRHHFDVIEGLERADSALMAALAG